MSWLPRQAQREIAIRLNAPSGTSKSGHVIRTCSAPCSRRRDAQLRRPCPCVDQFRPLARGGRRGLAVQAFRARDTPAACRQSNRTASGTTHTHHHPHTIVVPSSCPLHAEARRQAASAPRRATSPARRRAGPPRLRAVRRHPETCAGVPARTDLMRRPARSPAPPRDRPAPAADLLPARARRRRPAASPATATGCGGPRRASGRPASACARR